MQTLYDILTFWSVTTFSDVGPYVEQLEELKERLKDYPHALTFMHCSASNGPLFGSGAVIAIDIDCKIVGSIDTYIE